MTLDFNRFPFVGSKVLYVDLSDENKTDEDNFGPRRERTEV